MSLVENYTKQRKFIDKAKNSINPEVTLVQLSLLFEVARDDGGLRSMDLIERLDLGRMSVARAYRKLTDWEAPGKPGYGLIKSIENPNDRREKLLALTAKGKKVVKELDKALA